MTILNIARLEERIAELDAKGIHTLYLHTMAYGTADIEKIENHFGKGKGYFVECKRCPRRLWDVIISW